MVKDMSVEKKVINPNVKNIVVKNIETKYAESEERTAISFLIGLRQRFAMEMDEKIDYTPKELHTLIDGVLKQIRKHKLTPIDLAYIYNPPKKEDKVWGVVDRMIERSKIERYPWQDIFGHSLTKEILRLKKKNKEVDETYILILKDVRVQRFIEENKSEESKIMENLKTSVHARYGENNTAKKIEEEEI